MALWEYWAFLPSPSPAGCRCSPLVPGCVCPSSSAVPCASPAPAGPLHRSGCDSLQWHQKGCYPGTGDRTSAEWLNARDGTLMMTYNSNFLIFQTLTKFFFRTGSHVHMLASQCKARMGAQRPQSLDYNSQLWNCLHGWQSLTTTN